MAVPRDTLQDETTIADISKPLHLPMFHVCPVVCSPAAECPPNDAQLPVGTGDGPEDRELSLASAVAAESLEGVFTRLLRSRRFQRLMDPARRRVSALLPRRHWRLQACPWPVSPARLLQLSPSLIPNRTSPAPRSARAWSRGIWHKEEVLTVTPGSGGHKQTRHLFAIAEPLGYGCGQCPGTGRPHSWPDPANRPASMRRLGQPTRDGANEAFLTASLAILIRPLPQTTVLAASLRWQSLTLMSMTASLCPRTRCLVLCLSSTFPYQLRHLVPSICRPSKARRIHPGPRRFYRFFFGCSNDSNSH